MFEVQAVWTDLMRALIYLRDSDTFTVPRGLKSLVDAFGFGGEWHWEIIVTASVITTIPMIIVFFIAQRQIIDGVASSGPQGLNERRPSRMSGRPARRGRMPRTSDHAAGRIQRIAGRAAGHSGIERIDRALQLVEVDDPGVLPHQ